MTNYPEELKYSKSHEWVKYTENDTVLIGLTFYAQKELGDLVYVNLPEEGDDVEKGESFCDVESVKAVADVFSPVTGTVAAINEDLLDMPQKINEEPYEAWLAEIKGITETEELMDAAAYEAFVEAEKANK